MDRLFVLDIDSMAEYGSDGVLINYIIGEYARKSLDRVVYTSVAQTEKEIEYRGIKYKVIPISSVEKTREYLYNVYGVDMPPIEVPGDLKKYRQDLKVMLGKDIPKDNLKNSYAYFIKRIDKLKSWNNLLYDGDISSYIEPDALYSLSPRHNILSEWRVFVHKGEIVACQNYLGGPLEFPDADTIRQMVYDYKTDVPGAYTLDIAVIGDIGKKCNTIPLEVHPFVACGLYGFEDKRILDMWEDGFDWYVKNAR